MTSVTCSFVVCYDCTFSVSILLFYIAYYFKFLITFLNNNAGDVSVSPSINYDYSKAFNNFKGHVELYSHFTVRIVIQSYNHTINIYEEVVQPTFQ